MSVQRAGDRLASRAVAHASQAWRADSNGSEMNRGRWAMLVVLASIAASCSNMVADPGVPDPSDDQPGPAIEWGNPDTRVVFDEVGWAIAACEGDGPLLCVEMDGRHVGVVEAAAYPLASMTRLDPSAPSDVILDDFAGHFFDDMSADRRAGCGSDYVFERIEPTPFPLGDTTGIAFGFVGTMADGSPSELNLQYATVVGDRIVLVTSAAYDDDGCPGRDDLGGFRPGELADFRPYLEDVLDGSPLPPVAA